MSKPLRIPEEQLAAMIGRITVYWGDIHYAIFQFFIELTGIPNALAKTIFSKLRSDATQLEITEGAAKYVLPRGTIRPRKGGVQADWLYRWRKKYRAMWATHNPSGHVTPSPWVQEPRLFRKQEYGKQFAELDEKLKDLFQEVLRLQPDVKT
ncbi:hypothetical protein ACIOUF_25295 [Pseudomonas iridis]|uniref:HK97 gp10 family phage protein n=1 Tax=Pseudomonas iridis TaxID=2710587 RepID=A0ABW8DQX8_9PSED